jgi:hypothetical protein
VVTNVSEKHTASIFRRKSENEAIYSSETLIRTSKTTRCGSLKTNNNNNDDLCMAS